MFTPAPQDSLLQGTRVGFYTSVVGMGGSEVLVADAMEAAFAAGAEVVCWSEPAAAIRRIVSDRAVRLRATHLDWPRIQAASLVPIGHPGSRLGSAWRVGAPKTVRRWVGFRRTARRFADALSEVRPDLLFVNVNGSEGVSLAGRLCGTPVVNCYHLSLTRATGGPLARWGDNAARRATMHAGALSVHTSAAVRDEWCEAYQYPVSRTRLIYNGVDPLDPPDRAVTRAALGLSDDVFTFCVPGRLHPVKGHAHLIEAVRRNKGRFAGGRILVCGDGELRSELEQVVERYGLGDAIRFLGWRSDLPAVMAASDCVVLPSVASENLSVAVLEAMTAGTPAIVTRVGGMPEAVRDGETGLIVPPADPETLGGAMLRMLADRALARRMGQAAQAEALTRFTRDRMMAEYVTVFAGVLGRRPAEAVR